MQSTLCIGCLFIICLITVLHKILLHTKVMQNDMEVVFFTGVPHGDDLFYIFGIPLVGHGINKYHEMDKNVSEITMSMWSNFVKYGYVSRRHCEVSLSIKCEYVLILRKLYFKF